jgi:hypothetical protein
MEAPTASPPAPPRQRRLRLKPLLAIAVFGAAGVLGYFLGKSAPELPWLRQRLDALTTLDLLVMPVLILLVLAAHELGHLLGGFSRGMRFLLLIVGPFQWTRAQDGVVFRWNRHLGLMGGLAAATPDPDQPLVPQLRRLVAGGPLASLLLGVLGLAGGLWLDGRPGAYLVIFGFVSLGVFVVTALPLHAGGFMSDGMQFIELRRGGASVAERQVLLRLMGSSLGGIRPRDWDPALVQEALSIDGDVPMRGIAGRVSALYHAMDRGDSAQLNAHATWLAQHLDGYPDGFRQSIALELCLLAILAGDLDGARAWWQRSRGGVVDTARRWLVEARLAALEGDATRCSAALGKARQALPRGMDSGLNQLTADQLDAAGEVCRGAIAPAD